MDAKNIEERVKNIIVEQLRVEPDQVKPEAQFVNDLGADSTSKSPTSRLKKSKP